MTDLDPGSPGLTLSGRRALGLTGLTLLLGGLAGLSFLIGWGAGMNAWMNNTPAEVAWEVLVGKLAWLWLMLLLAVWFAHFLAPDVLYRRRTLLTVTLAVVVLVYALGGDYRAKRNAERGRPLPAPVDTRQ